MGAEERFGRRLTDQVSFQLHQTAALLKLKADLKRCYADADKEFPLGKDLDINQYAHAAGKFQGLLLGVMERLDKITNPLQYAGPERREEPKE